MACLDAMEKKKESRLCKLFLRSTPAEIGVLNYVAGAAFVTLFVILKLLMFK
jgi:hypothetical protein